MLQMCLGEKHGDGVDWIHMAQGWIKWRAFVEKVKTSGSIKTGKLFD
jgi:hypothetical protein